MIARLSAAFLLVLCILPTTAPFSTDGPADSLGHGSADTTIGVLTPLASVGNPDDDAFARERSDFLRQSRLSALVVASCDVAVVQAPFIRESPPTQFILDSPTLRTILRV